MTSRVEELYEKLKLDAETGGYHLNPDKDFTLALVEGLLANAERYGYMSCPCRLADGKRFEDLDIICPCDYRDADLAEHGACYCGLYVNPAKLGTGPAVSIPERRPDDPTRRPQFSAQPVPAVATGVWRCRVCGYLCARGEPPETCPICKASKDRFEPFYFGPSHGLGA